MNSPLASLSAAAPAAEEPLIAPGRFLRIWREHWRGATAAALVLAALLAVILLRQPAVYAASASLLVERSNDRVLDIKQVVDDSLETSLTDAVMLTHIQQLLSHTFLGEVVASLTPAQIADFLRPYPEALKISRHAALPPPPAAVVERMLLKQLKVQRSGRTLLIVLTLRHRNPAVAQAIVNQIADQYLLFLIHRSAASNDSALSFLSGQAKELHGQLEAAERELQQYREKHHLILLDHDQNLVNDRVRTMSGALTQARLDRLGIEVRLKQVRSILQNADAARELGSAPEFAAVAELQRRLDDLKAQRTILGDRYGPRHPLMVQNTDETAVLEKLRDSQAAAVLEQLGAQADRAAWDEKRVAGELASAEKDSLELDNLAVRDGELKRQVESVRDSYSQVLSRLNDTTISSRLQSTNLKFVDRASLPDQPAEPNPLRVAFLALFVGGIVLAGFPWAADRLDRRIGSWAGVTEQFHVPLLGEIPSVAKVPAQERGWIVARDHDEHAVEAFRTLHSQLQLSIEKARLVLVTSTIPGEGKTFVSANLGACYAAHGRRTLLIDADLRRPSLHRALGLDNRQGILTWDEKRGTRDVPLSRNPSLGIARLAPNLDLLRSGGLSRRITELLAAGSLKELIASLRQEYDLVIIDAPPAGVFPDAEVLARLSDQVIVVCRFKGADRNHVRQVLDRLLQSNIRLAGIVLNAIPAGAFRPNFFSAQGYSVVRYAGYYGGMTKTGKKSA